MNAHGRRCSLRCACSMSDGPLPLVTDSHTQSHKKHRREEAARSALRQCTHHNPAIVCASETSPLRLSESTFLFFLLHLPAAQSRPLSSRHLLPLLPCVPDLRCVSLFPLATRPPRRPHARCSEEGEGGTEKDKRRCDARVRRGGETPTAPSDDALDNAVQRARTFWLRVPSPLPAREDRCAGVGYVRALPTPLQGAGPALLTHAPAPSTPRPRCAARPALPPLPRPS